MIVIYQSTNKVFSAALTIDENTYNVMSVCIDSDKFESMYEPFEDDYGDNTEDREERKVP